MWEKAVYLAFFAELCLAQRAVIANINARQAEDLIPRAPQYDALPPNVFTTVLFPSVPTEAPTGIMVPTVITYTGTFDTIGGVPAGYSLAVPVTVNTVNNGQTMAESPTGQQPTLVPQPTVQPTQRPTEQPTQRPTHPPIPSQSATFTKPTPSRSADPSLRSDKPEPSRSHSQEPHTSSRAPPSSAPHLTSSHSTLIVSSRPYSTTPSSSSAQPTGTGLNQSSNSAQNTGPDANPHLSAGAIGGIVAGVIGGIGALAALLLFLLNRRKKEKAPDSPGIYPQEAYLYDPPITPIDGNRGPANPAGAALAGSGTPEMASTENAGLLGAAGVGAGAGAMAAAGAASRSRRDGYAPVDDGETQPANPFDDSAHEYRDRRSADPSSWPMNPGAPSGLATPPGTSAGPSGTQPSLGPQIAGVGSQRYERRVSQGPNRSSEYLAPPGNYNPAMREARRAWGMDE